jgi:HEAT repeat protein
VDQVMKSRSDKPGSSSTARESGKGSVPVWGVVLLIAAAGAVFLFFRAPSRQGGSETNSSMLSTGREASKSSQSFHVTMLSKAPAGDPNALAAFQKTLSTNTLTGQLSAQLLDEAAPLKLRRSAAFGLARLGSDEALKALNVGLLSTNSMVKASIAECLGECPHQDAPALLSRLLDDDDEVVARGAVRGIGSRGDAAAAEALSNILFDPDRPEEVRAEAALSLGDFTQPEALAALTRAINEIQDEAIIEQIWEGLGSRPFSETEALFRSYLESPNLSSEDKVMALEALANTEGDVAPLLLDYADDPDSEVRAAAAWGLVGAESQPELNDRVLEWVQDESSAEVRERLYEALSGQENLDPVAALALAQKESDPAARLAALGMAAAACDTASPELLAYFNQTAVPELRTTAVSGSDLGDRLNSVMALGRAGTPEALQALEEVARTSRDPSTVEAAQSILRHRGG